MIRFSPYPQYFSKEEVSPDMGFVSIEIDHYVTQFCHIQELEDKSLPKFVGNNRSGVIPGNQFVQCDQLVFHILLILAFKLFWLIMPINAERNHFQIDLVFSTPSKG